MIILIDYIFKHYLYDVFVGFLYELLQTRSIGIQIYPYIIHVELEVVEVLELDNNAKKFR